MTAIAVQGTCKPGYERVAEAFDRNFREHGEVGASVCLIVGGETVVDLWGGMANPKTGAPWARDTVSVVFSCTKGATAICAHVLASRGVLDIDAPVAELWPEFASNGKEHVTGRMMLDHSAGVPALRDKVSPNGFYEWDYMTGRLAEEAPFWEPGTRNGYHGMTFGWTVGELVRRASGKSLGTFFQDDIARPLGIDFWIGTPEAVEPRIAPMIFFINKVGAQTPFLADMLTKPQSPAALMNFNTGNWKGLFGANTREGRAAEIGAGNGVTNARGLAGLYAPLAAGGGKLVDARTLRRMGEVSMATHDDATLRMPTRFALGFMKSMDNRERAAGAKIFGPDCDSVILSSAAFGHVGAGGSIGFADPEAGFSFGYTMNKMGPGLLMNERSQPLVDAAYLSLGYASKDGGVWAPT
jgi:CubicO group peptidase (beta-lactamase class C family)